MSNEITAKRRERLLEALLSGRIPSEVALSQRARENVVDVVEDVLDGDRLATNAEERRLRLLDALISHRIPSEVALSPWARERVVGVIEEALGEIEASGSPELAAEKKSPRVG